MGLPVDGSPAVRHSFDRDTAQALFWPRLRLTYRPSSSARKAIQLRYQRFFGCALAMGLSLAASSTASAAVPCGAGNFQGWLDEFKAEATSKGISPATIAARLARRP